MDHRWQDQRADHQQAQQSCQQIWRSKYCFMGAFHRHTVFFIYGFEPIQQLHLRLFLVSSNITAFRIHLPTTNNSRPSYVKALFERFPISQFDCVFCNSGGPGMSKEFVLHRMRVATDAASVARPRASGKNLTLGSCWQPSEHR